MDSPTFVYAAEKVCSLLGVPNTCSVPMPETTSLHPGEVLLWYPGCTLTQLRNSPLGKLRMWQDQDWYDQHDCLAEPGYYIVQLLVPDSNRKTLQEQLELLPITGGVYQPLPVTVGVLTVLLHLLASGSLLQSNVTRCTGSIERPYVVLGLNRGRVYVDYDRWDDFRGGFVWLAGCRKV